MQLGLQNCSQRGLVNTQNDLLWTAGPSSHGQHSVASLAPWLTFLSCGDCPITLPLFPLKENLGGPSLMLVLCLVSLSLSFLVRKLSTFFQRGLVKNKTKQQCREGRISYQETYWFKSFIEHSLLQLPGGYAQLHGYIRYSEKKNKDILQLKI